MPVLDEATQQLIDGVSGGERHALARAITLAESTRSDHEDTAEKILDALLPLTGKSIRIGISGLPGAGKSTFIEAVGLHAIGTGCKVAVLAIDPSSSVYGGSILGDKTRMDRLATQPQAFVRPSPSGGLYGGVAGRTRENILLCEAAGYDVVFIETVGTGQSESAVAAMADVFVLLQIAGAGDELQAMKKGALELCDLVVVNKSDLNPAAAALAAKQINSSLTLSRPSGAVMETSALSGSGITAFWDRVVDLVSTKRATGGLERTRAEQNLRWMWERIEAGLTSRFRASDAVSRALPALREEVERGRISPPVAAKKLLQLFSENAAV